MKYVIIIPDGMADEPLKELKNKTPMEVAETPNMDRFAKEGLVGKVNNVPKGMQPGSDIANLSLLGYNPREVYTGRGPFEALNIGINLKETQVAFRCNLVTVVDDVMVDYSAGHITTKEAQAFMKFIDENLGEDGIEFYAGVSYRNIMLIDKNKLGGDLSELKCTPPHDILDKKIDKYLPQGKGSEIILDLMNKSKVLLEGDEINKVRLDLGENPANMIWLWGFGEKPMVPNFKEKFNVSGSIISAVGLLRGIGLAIGIEVIDVPGITGYYDTNYKGKADYAIKSLERNDCIYVHLEPTDEAGHNGHIYEKIKAIENIDRKVIEPIVKHLEDKGADFRILVVPDHPTPITVRTHTADPVPFVMYGTGISNSEIDVYSERILKKRGIKEYEFGYDMAADFFMKEEI
jgi:2,3-bisphosphoglycerate-independent phosphoglycerate mutase